MTSKFGVGNSKFHYGGSEGPVDTVYLGVFDAALFKELGGFDEQLVRNQDYELNIRIREAGRLVWFTPEMVVKYFPRSNISQLFWQFFQYGSWKRKVIFKHPKSMKIRQLAPKSSCPDRCVSNSIRDVQRLVSNSFDDIFISFHCCINPPKEASITTESHFKPNFHYHACCLGPWFLGRKSDNSYNPRQMT